MQKAMQQFAQLNITPAAAFPLLSPQYPYLYAQVHDVEATSLYTQSSTIPSQLIQQQAAVAGLTQPSSAATAYTASPLTVPGLLSPTSPSHPSAASPLGSSAGTPVG